MRKANLDWYKRFLSFAHFGESEPELFQRLYRDWGMDEMCLFFSISPSAFHERRRKLGVPLERNVTPLKQFDYLGQLRADIERYGLDRLIRMNEAKRWNHIHTHPDYEDPWTLEE